jgi:hypothetical protein
LRIAYSRDVGSHLSIKPSYTESAISMMMSTRQNYSKVVKELQDWSGELHFCATTPCRLARQAWTLKTGRTFSGLHEDPCLVRSAGGAVPQTEVDVGRDLRGTLSRARGAFKDAHCAGQGNRSER